MEEFESIKQLKEGLKQRALSRGKVQSKDAWYSRKRVIRAYTNFTGLNPDELIAEGVDSAMTRLTDYFMWLRGEEIEGIEPRRRSIGWNSACSLYSYIRGFYTHNDIVFPKRFMSPISKRSAISKRDSLTPLFEYDEEKDECYMNEMLGHFVSNLNFRDRTIAICLLATGADAADLRDLKVGFVRDASGHFTTMPRIPWHSNRLKDSIEFRTYFSKEATERLKQYVEQESADAGDEEYLFLNQYGRPLDARSLCLNFRAAAERMGYIKKGQINPFRPKRFRHAFREACSAAGADKGYVEALMGHSSSMSTSYLESGEGSFLREYIRIEPYITLFGSTRKEVTDLKETFSKKYETKIDTLKQRIDKIEDDMKNTLKQGLDKLADDVRKLKESSIESNKNKNEREEKWVHDIVYESAELINRMDDGWEIKRELKNGGFILCRQYCKRQKEEDLGILNEEIFYQLGELKTMELDTSFQISSQPDT